MATRWLPRKSVGRRPRGGSGRINVLIVGQGPPARGGIPSFAVGIIEDELLRRQFDLEFLNTTRAAVYRGGDVSLSNVRRTIEDAIRTYRRARHADVMHLQTAPGQLSTLLRAVVLCASARAAGARVLCHVHDGGINSGRAEAFQPGRISRWLLRHFPRISAVLTVSQPGAETLRPLMPHLRVEPVDNAVDVARFRRSKLDNDPPTLLYVGTLTHRKGLSDLVAALQLLRARGVTDWRLQIVGGPGDAGDEEAAELRDTVCAAGLQHSLVGALDASDVRRMLETADVFVLPSHWEGQPIAILEALAAGVPVISTRVGAIPWMIADGVEGLLVEPHRPEQLADALHQLISDPDRRKRMGEAAHAKALTAFDMPVLRSRLATLYRCTTTVGGQG